MVNGKIYIGKTTQPVKRRIAKHISSNGCPKLHNSIQKYGWQNFQTTYHDLGDCSEEELNDMEIAVIKEYKEVGCELMNLTDGGDGCSPSEETRKKISNGMKGKVRSKEHCKNLSSALIGRRCWSKGMKRPDHSKKMFGVNSPFARKIILIHPDKIEESFDCINDACRKYNLSQAHLSSVCSGKRKHHKRYTAKYI
jgi:group I intron endonuclease